MKILFLTPWFPTSPKDSRSVFILDSIQAQKALGIAAEIALTIPWKPRKGDTILKNKGIQTYRYLSIPRHYGRFISNWSYILKLRQVISKLIKQHNIQLIHAHTELSGMLAVHVAKKMNIPVVVTLHGIETCPRVWSGFSGKMIDSMLKRADRVIAVGAPLLDYFKPRLLSIDHFRVVSNGFQIASDMQDFYKKPWSKTIKIISVSNLHEGKGIDITLQALANLNLSQLSNWHYTIVGDGLEQKNLEKLVVKLGLGNQVSFVGLCTHDKVYEYLRDADVFCLPSYREAFGIAYLEAMAYGLLAIGVQGEGPEAFIEHKKTGLLVKPRDVQTLTEALKLVFEQEEFMQKIAEQGRLHVLKAFTWDKHAEHLIEVYKELVG
ncbi:MAG: glycosyltransferase [Legionella sp.]|nr:glycosyltransferase [Legionella sp.]